MRFGRYSAAMILSLAAALLCEAATAADGEAAFKARCAECHGPRDIQYWGRQRADAAKRAAWLDEFLRKHYPPPDAERALVIEHIQAVIAAATKR